MPGRQYKLNIDPSGDQCLISTYVRWSDRKWQCWLTWLLLIFIRLMN